ncbi:MAG: hypothetical protein ABL921_05895 [Pirellula sp.]
MNPNSKSFWSIALDGLNTTFGPKYNEVLHKHNACLATKTLIEITLTESLQQQILNRQI